MLSVAECLALPELSSMKVVAGWKGLTRTVAFSHVVEEPDVEVWVKPGLLALTTGHPLRSTDVAADWVKSLDDRGAAGIVLALGRYLPQVPESMRREADLRSIPLIFAPWELPFISIATAIHRRIMDAHTHALRRLADIQQQVTEAALNAKTVDALILRMSELTGEIVRLVPYPNKSASQLFPLPSVPGQAIACINLEEQVGRQLALVTSLFLLREQIRMQMEWDARSQYISRFLEGGEQAPLHAWAQHQPWSLHPDHEYTLCGITLPAVSPPITSLPHSIINEFRHAVWETLTDFKPFLTVSEPHDTLVAVVDKRDATADMLAERLETILRNFPRQAAIIGTPVTLPNLSRAFHTLIKLIPFAPQGRVSPENSMVYPLMVAELPSATMDLLYSLTWKKIGEQKLRQTLLIWMEESQNTASTLRRLGVHRNTLKNRLNQIETLLGKRLTPTLLTQLQVTFDWKKTVGGTRRA